MDGKDDHSKIEDIPPSHSQVSTLLGQACFYIHHASRSSHWEPPWTRWRCRLGLPYGWEQGLDHEGRVYYIDHIHETTTYSDPRSPRIPEGLRHLRIDRNHTTGFGFVAAGEQPVVVQFVSPGGPSDGLLFANDRIVSVGGVNVEGESKERVVSLVRGASSSLFLTVEQLCLPHFPPRRPCRVRFTDKVSVSSPHSPNTHFPPFLPDVLRVFLENGQTRSFKYDSNTTAKDVCAMLCSKLQLRAECHFSLAIESSLGRRSSRISLLEQDLLVQEILASSYSLHTRFVFRLAFIPLDPLSLFRNDPYSFEYYYSQCVNDVVCGRLAFEMRYEACIRVAALQMQQLALESSLLAGGRRVSLSIMMKEFGLATFLPTILLENVKKKEIRKHIRFYLKRDCGEVSQCEREEEASPCTEPRVALRLKYIQIVSHLPSLSCLAASVTLKQSQIDMLMQVDARSGILLRHAGKHSQPTISLGYDILSSVRVVEETEHVGVLALSLVKNEQQVLEFVIEKKELSNLVVHLRGYYLVHQGHPLPYEFIPLSSAVPTPYPLSPPPYASLHWVCPAGWNDSRDLRAGHKIVELSVAQAAAGAAEAAERVPPSANVLREGEWKHRLRPVDSLLINKRNDLHICLPLHSLTTDELISDSSDTDSSRSEAFPLQEQRQFLSSAETLIESVNAKSASKASTSLPEKGEVIDLCSTPPSTTALQTHHSSRFPFLHSLPKNNGIEKGERERSKEGGAKAGEGRRLSFPFDSTAMKRDGDGLQRANSYDVSEDGCGSIRRLSLAEFNGLEPRMSREDIFLRGWRSSSSSSSLLASFSARRRSLLCSPRKTRNDSAITSAAKRVEELLQESGKCRREGEKERVKIAAGTLASACNTLLRNISSSSPEVVKILGEITVCAQCVAERGEEETREILILLIRFLYASINSMSESAKALDELSHSITSLTHSSIPL